MEKTALELFRRGFRTSYEKHAYDRIMIFAYALKQINVDIPEFKMNETNSATYVYDLYGVTMKNISKISKECGSNYAAIINECGRGLDIYDYDSPMVTKLLSYLDKISVDEIKEFILEQNNTVSKYEDFSTPKSVCETIVKLLKTDKPQSWFDLGSGTGSFLCAVAREKKDDVLFGEDTNPDATLSAKLKLYFSGASEVYLNLCNVLDNTYNEKADVAFSNPPFAMRINKSDSLNTKNKFIRSLRPTQNADWMFVDRLVQSFKERGIVLMTDASLMNFTDEGQRFDIISKNLIEGVIKLPSNIFPYANISTSMLILNKRKNDNRHIKFLDASTMCKVGRRLNELNVDEIVECYNTGRNVIEVDVSKVLESEANLCVKKYIDVNNVNLINPTKLESVVEDLFRGYQIPASIIDENVKLDANEEVYKLLSIGDIQDGAYDIETLQPIKKDNRLNRYLIKNGDVVVSSKGTKIKTAYIEVPEGENILATGSILVIRCNKEKINPAYLKTFFDSSVGTKLLNSIQTGTAIISINARALLNMNISLLEKSKQDMVAKEYLFKTDEIKLLRLQLDRLQKTINNVFDEFAGE